MAQRAQSSSMAASEEAKECSICKEPGMDIGLRECLHIFHRECILKWKESPKQDSDKCPICRQDIKSIVDIEELVWKL